MADTTAIEWADSTFNPWEGCQKVGPGCDNCYAEARNARFSGGQAVNWGTGAPRRRTSPGNWSLPLRWQAIAAEFKARYGRRQRVFCASLADVFDNDVPGQWRIELMRLIVETPDLDWLLLTKRIGNAAGMLETAFRAVHQGREGWADNVPPNVWIGATVVNQAEVDRDVPKLLATPAAVRFLSIEPMLGPVDLWDHTWMLGGPSKGISWVICGGESGPKARPMHPDWARNLRDQCAAAGVPFLFKQWGEWAEVDGHKPTRTVHVESDIGETLANRCDGFISRAGEFVRTMDAATTDDPYRGMARIGKKAAGRQLDGRTHDGFPGVL
jgi:protein gp37